MKHRKVRFGLVLATAIIFALTGAARAQFFVTTVSQPYVDPNSNLTMFQVDGNIQLARFTSLPYNRKVAATQNVLVGNMTHGIPPQVYGHASVVFQYYPHINTINLFPGFAHITTWWGNQTCRVYENEVCNCNANPNWFLCGVVPIVVTTQVALATAATINATIFLEAAGFIVTHNAAADMEDFSREMSRLGLDLERSTHSPENPFFIKDAPDKIKEALGDTSESREKPKQEE